MYAPFKGSLASDLNLVFTEHILSRFRPTQLRQPVQLPKVVHLPTVPMAFLSEISNLKNTVKYSEKMEFKNWNFYRLGTTLVSNSGTSN